MKFEAVLFDLDGTLVDTLEDLADVMNGILEKRGYPIHPVDSYRYRVGWGLKVAAEKSLPEEALIPVIVEECIQEFLGVYGAQPVIKTKPYNGMPEVLDELEKLGIRKMILSNKPDLLTQRVAEILLSSWEFESIQGSRKEIPSKPDPVAAFDMCRSLGISPDSVLYLGDSAVDMETAVNAGMYPLGALWGFRDEEELREAGAADVIAHPLEILPFLK